MMKKLLLTAVTIGTALTVWLYFMPLQVAHSQGETEVQCGEILDRDFTSNVQDHIYELPIEPRWSFDVSVKPYGDDLRTVIALYGPTGNLIDLTDGPGGGPPSYYTVLASPTIASGTLSSRGPYRIRVANTAIRGNELVDQEGYFGGVGFYTLSIGCTTNDGRRIAPGDIQSPTSTPEPDATPALTTASDSPPIPAAPPFLESGKSYDVHLNSAVIAVTVVEIRDDGWIQVIIENRVGWLNLSQVALIVSHDE